MPVAEVPPHRAADFRLLGIQVGRSVAEVPAVFAPMFDGNIRRLNGDLHSYTLCTTSPEGADILSSFSDVALHRTPPPSTCLSIYAGGGLNKEQQTVYAVSLEFWPLNFNLHGDGIDYLSNKFGSPTFITNDGKPLDGRVSAFWNTNAAPDANQSQLSLYLDGYDPHGYMARLCANGSSPFARAGLVDRYTNFIDSHIVVVDSCWLSAYIANLTRLEAEAELRQRAVDSDRAKTQRPRF
jgi:hypothetical protein